MRSSGTTLADLRGENALTIVGTIGSLLRQVDRAVGTEHEKAYRAEALSGDYAHVCEVSERYALQFLATTLHAEEGDLTVDDEGDGDDWEDDY